MTSSNRGRPPRLPPPAASRRPSGTRPAARPRPRKPPRVEYLADDQVHDDGVEFLADELVLDASDAPDDGAPVFAGVSDAPPPLPALRVVPLGENPPVAHPQTGAVSPDGPPAFMRTLPPLRRSAYLLGLALAVLVGIAMGQRAYVTPEPAPPSPARAVALASPLPAAARASHAMPPPPEPVAPLAVMPSLPDPTVISVAASPAPSSSPSIPSVAPRDALGPGPAGAAALSAQHAAQEALEHGKVATAIDLGQRAIGLDPSDAESWLILGAAYLQHGDYKKAHRAFADCAAQATRGPRSECSALQR